MRPHVPVALLLAAVVAGVPLSGAAALRYPPTATAVVGGMRIVSQPDDDALLSGIQVFVAGGLAHETPATNGAAALLAECILRTPASSNGATGGLRDVIAQTGGTINYTVEDTTVHYYIEARPERAPEVVALFARALSQPDLSPATVAAARSGLQSRVGEGERNPLRVGVEMFKESFLEAGSAFPDYGTVSSLSALGPAALRAFYDTNYRRAALTASVVGKVTPELTSALGGLAQALPAGPATAVNLKAKPLPVTPTRIIAERDVGKPFVVVGFAAPAPGARDFGAMLMVESMLSDAFKGSGATTISPAERPVGAFYLYQSAPASLVVYVNGGSGVDPDLALRDVLLITKALAAKRMDADTLKTLKDATAGEFVTDATSLSDRSYLIGTFADGQLAQTSINGALQAIEGTTSADLQRAAKDYLQRYIVALVLPRRSQ
jgi:predicted Zn-dependent peptidase